MVKINELQAKYLTDENGKKTDVVLPIGEFEELLEDISDLATLLERRDESAIPLDDVVAKLKADGLLPNRD